MLIFVDIAQKQLDIYTNSAAFQDAINTNVQTLVNAKDDWGSTAIGQAMAKEFTTGMSHWEEQDWASGVQSNINSIQAWQAGEGEGTFDGAITTISNSISAVDTKIDTLGTMITGQSVNDFTASARQSLKAAGFEESFVDSLSTDRLSQYSGFIGEEGDAATLDSLESQARQKASSAGIGPIQSRKEYYQGLQAEGTNIDQAKTYEGYLRDKISEAENSPVGIENRARELVLSLQNNPDFEGMKTVLQNSEFQSLLGQYQSIGKNPQDLKEMASSTISTGVLKGIPGVSFKGYRHFSAEVGDEKNLGAQMLGLANGEEIRALNALVGGSPSPGWMGMVNGKLFVYSWDQMYQPDLGTMLSSRWYPVATGSNDTGGGGDRLVNKYLSELRKYETGGLADFTGPAWLDGTKSHPELVLNARDTQNFLALKDILSDVMKNNVGSGKSGSSGDNYFDIEINVESLENDYDVEQIADKIRDMIYSDATRRNVNAVNQKK